MPESRSDGRSFFALPLPSGGSLRNAGASMVGVAAEAIVPRLGVSTPKLNPVEMNAASVSTVTARLMDARERTRRAKSMDFPPDGPAGGGPRESLSYIERSVNRRPSFQTNKLSDR